MRRGDGAAFPRLGHDLCGEIKDAVQAIPEPTGIAAVGQQETRHHQQGENAERDAAIQAFAAGHVHIVRADIGGLRPLRGRQISHLGCP